MEKPKAEKKRRFTKKEWSWILYDWANSVYATNIMAAIFPTIFVSIAGEAGDIWWGYATSIATFLVAVLAPLLGWLGIPPETVGLMLVRPISGSAALGVGSELISTYGPDSTIGRTAAVMLGSTETTFYTIAVYFGATGIRKSRYAVPAALCADAAGFFFAALTVRLFMK